MHGVKGVGWVRFQLESGGSMEVRGTDILICEKRKRVIGQEKERTSN
jgi:hypothetical protein